MEVFLLLTLGSRLWLVSVPMSFQPLAGNNDFYFTVSVISCMCPLFE